MTEVKFSEQIMKEFKKFIFGLDKLKTIKFGISKKENYEEDFDKIIIKVLEKNKKLSKVELKICTQRDYSNRIDKN